METDVCGFIDLLFALGLEFDQNPQYAWVAAILKDTSRNPTARMAQVREIVARHAEQVG